MPKGHAPSVYLSSTCYDLGQVRADIRSFIESMGFDPVLSEYRSFPVDPDVGTVENCLKTVDSRADLFVLIVGGRYGSQTDQGKSVTNLEYLRARAKGIPIYVFVLKSILNVLPVWKSNPQGDFNNVVDTPKLFGFVEALKGSGEVWVYPFETAQDIIATLRTQLAILFMEALHLRTQAKAVGLPDVLAKLRGEALRLVVERPLAWEARLFSQVLSDELQAASNIKRDMDYGIALGEAKRFDDVVAVSQWLSGKAAQLVSMGQAINKLFNVAIQDAMGLPGQPGDPEKLVYAAKKLAEAYRYAINWTIELQQVETDEEFRSLVSKTSKLPKNMIGEVEQYSQDLKTGLEQVIATHVSGEQRRIEFNLTLTAPDTTELLQEIEKLRQRYS